eukprot:superscaffoldBa00000003_g81
MTIALPPQPPAKTPVEDFTMGLLAQPCRKPCLCVVVSKMAPIFSYAQHEWVAPLSAKPPMVAYGQATLGVALSNNMAFLVGLLDRLIHQKKERLVEEITEVQMTAATFLQMSQALTINSGRTMAASHVGHRHLWLGLSSLKEHEQHLLLNAPLSTQSFFSIILDIQLGFAINPSKSTLQLSQQMPYLGLLLDSQAMTARLSEKHVKSILQLTLFIISVTLVPAISVTSLLGMMSVAHLVLRLGLLQMRNLQRWFAQLQLHPNTDSNDHSGPRWFGPFRGQKPPTGEVFPLGGLQADAPCLAICSSVGPPDLAGPPFEPLDQADLEVLSLKMMLLLALVSAKRAGDLCALSLHPSCMSVSDGRGSAALRPNPSFLAQGYHLLIQVEGHQAFFPPPHANGEEEWLHTLCPICALCLYVEHMVAFRKSDRKFVCHGGQAQGAPLSVQRLAHWVCDVIRRSYEVMGLTPPEGLREYSIRGITSLMALAWVSQWRTSV